MARDQRFTFLTNENERQQIARLAELLQRTESDAVRYVIGAAVQSLDTPQAIQAAQPQQPQAVSHVTG